ncbi:MULTISPECIES: hypothetical protein [unclassified Bradyrhizobium]|uniref:hypothetical protein n=1 Tax=unclassified Bradyrhizobium TaxID=2631580 RepID=UPI001CD28FD2|nr:MULTISPECIES: hypothetical protein [unclassified Bradyrhizobium]MCA1377085.1 hypothetical protein [Bradyrhizobium sp. IC4060]MCA1484041.1 hypothetical protein [Bradyrhizobium sp. IC4061]
MATGTCGMRFDCTMDRFRAVRTARTTWSSASAQHVTSMPANTQSPCVRLCHSGRCVVSALRTGNRALVAKPEKFGRGAVSSSYRYGAAGRVRLIHVPRWWHHTPVLPDDQANFAKTEIDRFPGPIMPRFAVDVRADLIALVSR